MLPVLFACSVAVFSLLFLLILDCGDGADVPKDGTIAEVAESQIGEKGKVYWSWYGFGVLVLSVGVLTSADI